MEMVVWPIICLIIAAGLIFADELLHYIRKKRRKQ